MRYTASFKRGRWWFLLENLMSTWESIMSKNVAVRTAYVDGVRNNLHTYGIMPLHLSDIWQTPLQRTRSHYQLQLARSIPITQRGGYSSFTQGSITHVYLTPRFQLLQSVIPWSFLLLRTSMPTKRFYSATRRILGAKSDITVIRSCVLCVIAKHVYLGHLSKD